MTISFVAFDVETANSYRGSICQIGLVKVEDGEITDKLSSFIMPPEELNYFDPYNITIHGITSGDVAQAPKIVDFLEQFEDFLDGLPLVAHHAAFDVGALRDSLDAFGQSYPTLDYLCTLVLSRRTLDLISYSLPDVAEALEIQFQNHHQADADALACAQILIELGKKERVNDLNELISKLGVRSGRLEADSWRGCRSISQSKPRFTPDQIGDIKLALGSEELNEESPLVGKRVVFTGTLGSMSKSEAQARVLALGAFPDGGVTKKTDYLVYGVQDPAHLRAGAENSNKFEKALLLRQKGSPIEIIDEVSFLRMLYKD